MFDEFLSFAVHNEGLWFAPPSEPRDVISQFHRANDDLIAVMRKRTLVMRLAMGVLAALTAWLLHAATWPALWLVPFVLTQIGDFAVFRRPTATWMRMTSLFVSSTVFSSLMVYNWFTGGEAGQVFATVSLCCVMMSAVVSLYPSRLYLAAALIPHAVCLAAPPLVTWALAPRADLRATAVIMTGVIVYLIYLSAGARKLNAAMAALRAGGAEAERLRYTAEAANAAKSNVLTVISHEIRTPMNAVVAAIALLRRTRLDDEQTAHVAMLGEAGDMLLGLLNDVLDLSKMDAGKMTLEIAPIEVSALMANLSTLFRPQAAQKGVALRTSVDPQVAPEVLGDPLRLRQILLNLVSNAVKFTDNGAVRINVRATTEAEPRLLISVEDDGIGIAAADLERVFLSFEQAELTTPRRRGGTGMGLAISRRLARLMGGDLSVTSVEGQGSSFTLSLPYAPSRAPVLPIETGAIDAVKTAPVHVLIVDDHEVNRRIVSLFIEPLGWAWTMAETGAEAVELCQTKAFDVILMDMQMPAMDGLTATRAIRGERGPNQATPIVALSANAMDHHRQAWAEVGVADFLAKPIDPETLISTLAYKASGHTSAASDVA